MPLSSERLEPVWDHAAQMAHQRIEKWRRWIDGRIKDEVVSMHSRWDTWSHVQKMLAANPALPDSHWWQFMADTYLTTQAVAVRRQLDTHKDVASLGKLLEEIAAEPEIITKAFWLERVGPADRIDRALADEGWSHTFGGAVGDHLDPEIPVADLELRGRQQRGYCDTWIGTSLIATGSLCRRGRSRPCQTFITQST